MKNTKSHKGQDPAFLFYTSDFLTGTMLMSNEQVGAYIRLMCLQHQKGKLTEKDMLNICKTYDEDVFQKFTKDEHGLYENERLQFEIQRRIDYTESRRNNRLNKNISTSYVQHMENENENEIVNKKNKGKRKKFIPPSVEEVIEYFKSNGYSEEAARKAHEHYRLADWHDAHGNPVLAWKQKMFNNWFKEEYRSNVVKMGKKLKAVGIAPNQWIQYEDGSIYPPLSPHDFMEYKAGRLQLSHFDRVAS